MADYPSKKELEELVRLAGKPDFTATIEYLKQIWNTDYGALSIYETGAPKKTILRLSTGGWSGNEAIIERFQGTTFWYLFWKSSHRGGHDKFEIEEAELNG